jgi:oxidase EvaA
VSDGAWSEQASRFLRKKNRNRVVVVPGDTPAPEPVYRWIPASLLRPALGEDFAVNTDARSVIATAPWTLIGGAEPFSGDLRKSHRLREDGLEERIRSALGRRRAGELRTIPLEVLPDGVLGDGPTPLAHPHFDVVHRRTTARTREVDTWDQPLASGNGIGRVTLALARVDGVLKALLGIDRSPALPWGAELTATRVAAPGRPVAGSAIDGEVLAAARVSDEGGRFDNEVSQVEVMLIRDPAGTEGTALTLGDLERVVRAPGLTTNELRTAVGVLLSLA